MTKRGFALAALLLAGCNIQVLGGVTPTGSIAPLATDAVVFRFESRGGFCPPPGCGVDMSFRADGRFSGTDKRVGAFSGKVDPQLVTGLRQAIARADFKALRAIDRDKICRTIADAPDQTWSFNTGAGTEAFSACSAGFDEGAIFDEARKLIAATSDVRNPSPKPSASPTAKPTPSPGASPTPAASPTPTAAPSGAPDDAVVTVAAYGGMCPDFPCGSETTYQRDGRYVTTKGAKELGAGKVPAELVATVVAEIAKADFQALKSKPFTGTCPTAYDGAEVTYTFRTGGGEEKLGACTYDLPQDDPLIKATQALETARYAED